MIAEEKGSASWGRRLIAIVPLAIFAALAGLFLLRLHDTTDRSNVPSVLIGRPAPATTLPPVEGLQQSGKPLPGITPDIFAGKVTLVNVWASWCVPCRDEAALLHELARDTRIQLIGINYKDQPQNAREFITRYGNPFVAVGGDMNGRASIEWGVYGVPETFVVGLNGRIVHKVIGPITPDNLVAELKPAIEKALAP